jgi:hypothetical protein
MTYYGLGPPTCRMWLCPSGLGIHLNRGVGGGVEFVFTKRVDRISVGELRVDGFEIEIGVMNYGFDIDGILGMDFLVRAGAVVNLGRVWKYVRRRDAGHDASVRRAWRRRVFLPSVRQHPARGAGADRVERNPERIVSAPTARSPERLLPGVLPGGVVRCDPGLWPPHRTPLRRPLAQGDPDSGHRPLARASGRACYEASSPSPKRPRNP